MPPEPPAPDLTQPPELANVSDAQLSAFLHVVLFDAQGVRMWPCWRDYECGDWHACEDPEHPDYDVLDSHGKTTPRYCTLVHPGEWYPYEVLDDLVTPSGAVRVIEAMGERGLCLHDRVRRLERVGIAAHPSRP